MTKAKALKLMLEYARYVLNPRFASKLAQAMGYSLSQLGFRKEHKYVLTNAPYKGDEMTARGIATYELARKIAEQQPEKKWSKSEHIQIETLEYQDGRKKKRLIIPARFHGAGSNAQSITEEAVKIIKN